MMIKKRPKGLFMSYTRTLSIPNILGLVSSYSAQQNRSLGYTHLGALSNVTVGN